ncbi:Protein MITOFERRINLIKE 1, chloroplastic [Gracilariopsis chorda]|uniref:Protein MITOFERRINLIKE 1, chloroplastic n=1 Tax=Gracilariopsis chorda TaxID=448386 RepID=A0A2V3J0Y3_9FLOR|nr:Protein MITOFERRINLIKE 1, chloroplastic [Gracilariopsis chorda]|eukprot:PXF48072.1 Protein MITOFERRINLIKE 1, chloroplastic [Gracilariopsis chorda]
MPKDEPRICAISHGSLRQTWRLAAAGGMAGMLTNTLLHPLDTVKTVRQADPTHFRGMAPTLLKIIRTRGPFALYAGIVPALIGSAFSSALYFGAYEMVKGALAQMSPYSFQKPRTRIPLTALSAACGNVASSVLFVPKEVVKQRMQSAVDPGNFFGAAKNVLAASGISGLYRGYKATLLRNIPSTMLRFAIYEEAKLAIRRLKRENSDKPLTFPEVIAAGSIAGVASSACTTPMDVLKTRFATGAIKPGTAILPAIRDIVGRDGVPGLFVGIRPRIVWAALFAAIGFSSYEVCKSWVLDDRAFPLRNITRQRVKEQYTSNEGK